MTFKDIESKEKYEKLGRREEEGKPVLHNSSGSTNEGTKVESWKPPRGNPDKGNQILFKQIFDKPGGEARNIDFG